MSSNDQEQGVGDGASGSGATTVTVQFNTDFAAAQRFPAWLCLAVFSAICIAAMQSRKGLFSTNSAGEAWVLSVQIMSFLLSLIAVAMYLLCRAPFVGQVPEVVMVALLVVFWAASLPTVMNPGNRIAVSPPTTTNVAPIVTNANLYFFSWLAFSAALFLSASVTQEIMGVNVRNVAAKAARWYGLTAASMVVMGSAVRIYQTEGCNETSKGSTSFCKRTKFAISIGVAGFFIAGIMTLLVQQKKQLTIVFETAITTLQLILWCFGVGYMTFGTSPGSTIGNLFFGSWIAFILTVLLFAVSFRECVAGGQYAGSDGEATPEQGQAPQPEFDE